MTNYLDDLKSPKTIRSQSLKLFEAAKSGKTHFQYHPDRLQPLVEFVIEVIRNNYPDLNIPFHSRWRHFTVGGTDRAALLTQKCKALTPLELAQVKLDLAIVSVLLDAGAGESWKYTEPQSKTFSRSEGLAVASFWMFMEGAFSHDPNFPYQVTAQGLLNLDLENLKKGFQVSASNPLIGVQGRLELLHSLGQALQKRPDLFAQTRPGGLVSYFKQRQDLTAVGLLRAILDGLGPIWPGRITLEGVNLGDCWRHPLLGPLDQPSSLIPFHKLSQWLTYSLIEPLEEADLRIQGVHELTGLPEYRNGGLLLDLGLLSLRDPIQEKQIHRPESELIIEWRALTVTCLDLIAKEVRTVLGFDEVSFPLAKVLEGGTWWAGRKAAQSKRADGSPPLRIQSDGTVF